MFKLSITDKGERMFLTYILDEEDRKKTAEKIHSAVTLAKNALTDLNPTLPADDRTLSLFYMDDNGQMIYVLKANVYDQSLVTKIRSAVNFSIKTLKNRHARAIIKMDC